MKIDENQNDSIRENPSKKGLSNRSKSKAAALAVAAIVGIYSLAVPHINQRLGLDLPQLRTDSQGRIEAIGGKGDRGALVATDSDLVATDSDLVRPKQSKSSRASSAPARRSEGPLAERMRPAASQPGAAVSPHRQATAAPSGDDSLLYGLLRKVSADRYISPSGLMYTPGSAEGHRLEHLKRHIQDDPERPGSHGVFDGEMEGALKTIDRAFERAKKGTKTTKRTDQGRTIYTVDMGGRVGYVGGRDGNRKRKPMARRVRLVIEGNRVITAYPM